MFQILSIALYVCTEPLIRVPKTLHELQAIAKIQTLCRLSFHSVKNFHQVECTPSPTMYTLRRYSDLVHYAFYLLYVFEIWTSKKYTQLTKLFFLCPSRKKIAATALSRRKRAVDRDHYCRAVRKCHTPIQDTANKVSIMKRAKETGDVK